MKKKKVIAVDIDECLVPYITLFAAYFNKHAKRLGIKKEKDVVTSADFFSYHFSLPLKISEENTQKVVDAFQASDSFYVNKKPIKGSVEVILKLSRKYRLIIVTSRQTYLQKITEKMMEKLYPKCFEKVILCNIYGKTGKKRTKGDVVKEIGADLLIDDSYKYCLEVAKNGKNAILFGNYPWNVQKDLHKGIVRVKGWSEVEKIVEKYMG